MFHPINQAAGNDCGCARKQRVLDQAAQYQVALLHQVRPPHSAPLALIGMYGVHLWMSPLPLIGNLG
ncbi:unannotated protein [freshwater metagenome]|uniref:Unannotated protein n=1 Tax=freshwater metagenome TaxID=449393 RepID=A0A6J5ZS99_9ZZZZ